MAPRHLTRRLLAGLLALWFAVVATGGALVDGCAMHGGATAAEMTAAMGGAAGDDAAMHGHHAATQAQQGDGHQSGHQCSCPDASCGTSVVATVAPRVTTHFAIAVADVRAVFSPARGHEPVAVPYLTPFANGPPPGALA